MRSRASPSAAAAAAASLLACVTIAQGRVVWTRVQGYVPSGEADLETAFHTLADAQSWCGRNSDCGSFTYGKGIEDVVAGAVVHVRFTRTAEWFPDTKWTSFVKRLTPCADLVYRTHRSGLLCCDGACPKTLAEARTLECEPQISVQGGTLPLCSALDAPAVGASSTSWARSWPPVRVMNLARAGTASMSSVYDSFGPWKSASFAIDHSLTTMIHTKCGSSEWWRVELPSASEVAQVVVINRHEFKHRLLSFELQLLSEGGTVLEKRHFGYTANRTAFVFESPQASVASVRLHAVKGAQECLHILELQVLGRALILLPEHRRVRALLGSAEVGGSGGPDQGGPILRSHAAVQVGGATSGQMCLAGLLATLVLVSLQARHVRGYLHQGLVLNA
ncbi:hypothetical protein T492DRAFT_1056220 [Pavlovales sp. CCMP2436]|nr:hypothetical protein T492DRAFT_1056220 [Pavlovales sp. CCMP2436]|mmetsp:Transcript_44190/g.109395  ORF Transcript_44190/g.109395 Transcript_44190/m.109395 type:complete len:392 (-) Transcript_44190:66-1241(-)